MYKFLLNIIMMFHLMNKGISSCIADLCKLIVVSIENVPPVPTAKKVDATYYSVWKQYFLFFFIHASWGNYMIW